MPNSYKVVVKTKTDKDWIENDLRFNFEEEAQRYAKDLKERWSAVVSTLIQYSDDRANAKFPVTRDRYHVERKR